MKTIYPAFLDLAPSLRDPQTARYRIVPVPFDGTSTFRKGADKGPYELLSVSDQLEEYDIETATLPCRSGIFIEEEIECAGTSEEMVENVEAATTGILSREGIPVILGGEHSVSVGGVWAAAAAFPDLTVLQLDAHSDLRMSYHGSPFNHACVMARIAERAPILQAGIRSMDICETDGLDDERIFYAHQIHDNDDWIPRLAAKLTGHLYVTIDLDVFDPSILPSTGTPQPGGLGWYQILRLLRAVTQVSQVVGFDIVELCPDGSSASPMLAAKLLYKMIAYIETGRDPGNIGH